MTNDATLQPHATSRAQGIASITLRMAASEALETMACTHAWPVRLDAPSLALAIRCRDLEAVRSMVDQGAQFDVHAWGCTTATDQMVQYEQADNDDGNCHVARRIAAGLKAESRHRERLVDVELSFANGSVVAMVAARPTTPCTWEEPMPEVLAPGAFGSLEQRDNHLDPQFGGKHFGDTDLQRWVRSRTHKYNGIMMADGSGGCLTESVDEVPYWRQSCTCASRRVLPNVETVGQWVDRTPDGHLSSDKQASYEWERFLEDGCDALDVVPSSVHYGAVWDSLHVEWEAQFVPVIVAKPLSTVALWRSPCSTGTVAHEAVGTHVYESVRDLTFWRSQRTYNSKLARLLKKSPRGAFERRVPH